jgi:hypothetical protein
MSKDLIDEQIETDLADNNTRAINESRIRGVLKGVTSFMEEVRVVSQSAIDLFNQIYNPAINAATQAAASAASAQALVTGASTARPSIRPSLLLDFVNSRSLDSRITFTRASIGTYFDSKGLVKVAASGEARIGFDPLTGKCLGLLVEESRANAFLRSEEFDNASWTKAGSTVTANTTTSPDGTQNADTIIESATTGGHYVSQSANFVNGQSLTVSCFMKAATRTTGYISFYNGTSTLNAYFNLSAGTVLSTSGTLVASIVSVGNGWFRVVCTYASTVTATGNVSLGCSVTNTQSYTGDGTSGIYLWGAQLEIGAFVTSYIPTTTAAVTRQVDFALMNGVNFADWYNQNEGTFYVDYTLNTITGTGNRLFAVGDSANFSTKRAVDVYKQAEASATMYIYSANEGAVQVSSIPPGQPLTVGVSRKMAVAMKDNDVTIQIDNIALATDNTVTLQKTNNTLSIGAYLSGVGHLNGFLACLAYFPRRLSNTELLALTTSALLAGKNANQLPTVGDLGSAAFVQLRALLAMRNRQEFQILGTGTSQSYTIRRPYAFQFRTVDVPSGSTVTATPSTTVASSEDTDYTLTITVAVGKLFTYSITPIVPK